MQSHLMWLAPQLMDAKPAEVESKDAESKEVEPTQAGLMAAESMHARLTEAVAPAEAQWR